ncbi:MAG: hypothetical protein Q7T25_04230 [Sideroxyarcus sp.]|nr:hypothetical protein [Sideroxyarcus sp.]
MLVTLALTAVASFVGAVVLSFFQVLPPAAIMHLALAVGVMPLIMGAMTHFVPVLSLSTTAHIIVRLIPLLAMTAGALTFFSLAVANQVYFSASHLALAATVVFAAWIVRRAIRAVGKPHPCLYWYLGAIACLILALVAVSGMALWPEQRQALKRLHLHLNTLGFIGLTAVATLQVLMPTVVGRPDPQAAARLRQHLKWAVGGTLLVAIGAAWFKPLAYLGIALWVIPLVQLGRAWIALYFREICQPNGAAASLAAAYIGFIAMLLFGALHAYGILNTADATLAFILAFLLPLVTGAVSQLLPIWVRTGPQTVWHAQVRQQLGAGAGYRAMLFLAGGLLVGLGWRGGLMLSIAALIIFILQLAVATRCHGNDRRIGQ